MSVGLYEKHVRKATASKKGKFDSSKDFNYNKFVDSGGGGGLVGALVAATFMPIVVWTLVE